MSWRPVVMAISVGAAVGLSAQEPLQRFAARIDVVRLDVLVTDRQGVVAGLGAADFEVLDNDVPQQIDLVSFEEIPINAILALDLSRSVAGDKLANLREAGRALVGALRPKDQAALVSFGTAVTPGPALTPNLADVLAVLNRAAPAGNTSLIDACFAGLILGESDAGRALLVVFSDGLDTSSWLTHHDVLDTARRSDAVVYAFTTTGAPGASFLRDLTAATGGALLESGSTRNLTRLFLGVLEEFRRRYLVSYTPRGVPKNGWHRIDVRVKRPDAVVKARPGYQAGS